MPLHRAEVLRFRGDLDRATRDASDAIDELTEAAPRWAAWGLHELGEIRRRRGDLSDAMEAFRRSIELGFDPQPGLALLRLDEGKPTGARRAIVAALSDQNGLTREGRWLILPAAVEIAIAANDGLWRDRRSASWITSPNGSTPQRSAPPPRWPRGRVALSDSRIEDAARDLRRGVGLWSDADAPYETAQARELLADAFTQLGDEDAAELELVGRASELRAHGRRGRCESRREASGRSNRCPGKQP